jgi:large subunit ribosomal protein L4
MASGSATQAATARQLGPDGKETGTVDVPAEFVPADLPVGLLKRTIVDHLANMRRGTQSSRSRGEIRGGGRKPWRQKGTGRARQGTIRAPHWRGGGVVFAPKPRDYSRTLNRRERATAFRAAVGLKVAAAALSVIGSLDLADEKTRTRRAWLDAAGLEGRALLVDVGISQGLARSTANLQGVVVARADTVSASDILSADHVVVSTAALEAMRKRRGDESA